MGYMDTVRDTWTQYGLYGHSMGYMDTVWQTLHETLKCPFFEKTLSKKDQSETTPIFGREKKFFYFFIFIFIFSNQILLSQDL